MKQSILHLDPFRARYASSFLFFRSSLSFLFSPSDFPSLSCSASSVCTNYATNAAGRINFPPSPGEIGRLPQIFAQTY